ncbi:hypothetical protein PTTG_00090 [Puccinia triticina 1-1 BBBD Race 1]|uniref:INTRADIOL_DIOXYGENAS domain-containing protein n=2 Tax=Puccinia triticina TaxID=208348 RepID=A0A180GVZ0_PUCT1|nr:uncharacterized protein PtA15_6A267 [Puccinia triticina]OAV96997.1 hypothetical protein PTTG_00090 [Puccinia triticina 1-1 BBBD Race 1]WAQ85639.1 hypothetical protein PtA15_6A267 [Puccinia triticina]WAR55519.1 hypothetical protein PtB15_6B260 [Puccinia triticina]
MALRGIIAQPTPKNSTSVGSATDAHPARLVANRGKCGSVGGQPRKMRLGWHAWALPEPSVQVMLRLQHLSRPLHVNKYSTEHIGIVLFSIPISIGRHAGHCISRSRLLAPSGSGIWSTSVLYVAKPSGASTLVFLQPRVLATNPLRLVSFCVDTLEARSAVQLTKPGSMAWSISRIGINGTFYTSPPTIFAILLLYHSFLSCFSEPSRPILEHRALPATKSDQPNSTSLQGSHYIKNTFLRSNLKENQTGFPLSIQFTVLDTDSCAPVENALVEIWGSNSHGAYSGEPTGSSPSQADCSSWLRGGLGTDSEGIARFETIYPGPEVKRAPRIYAIVRTDWYEIANQKTIDSDSVQYAAATGQVFFPDELNEKIYKDPNYKDASTKAVKNEADPSYKVDSGSWKAQAEPFDGGSSGGVRAHVTISLNINAPPKIEIGTAPGRCTPGSNNPPDSGGTERIHPPQEEQSSTAPSFQPPIIAIMMISMMLIYGLYGHGGPSDNGSGKSQKCHT